MPQNKGGGAQFCFWSYSSFLSISNGSHLSFASPLMILMIIVDHHCSSHLILKSISIISFKSWAFFVLYLSFIIDVVNLKHEYSEFVDSRLWPASQPFANQQKANKLIKSRIDLDTDLERLQKINRLLKTIIILWKLKQQVKERKFRHKPEVLDEKFVWEARKWSKID